MPSVSPLTQLLDGCWLGEYFTSFSLSFLVSFLLFSFSFSCYPRFLVAIPLLPLMSYNLWHFDKYWFVFLFSFVNPGPSESQIIHTPAGNVKHEYMTLKVLCLEWALEQSQGFWTHPLLCKMRNTQLPGSHQPWCIFICFKRHKLLGRWNGRTAVTYKERKIFASCAD